MIACNIKEQDLKDFNPWTGLSVTCIRLLQLYSRVFDQDIQNSRKTCKNCKCTKDGHEVVAEHGARARLGFVSNMDALDARQLGYTFVPPGLTSARQVEQYYSTLPSHEVPKLGSKGEISRSQRIVRQLPKQDLALSACKHVEPEYTDSYQDFVSGRNQVALDVGVAKPAPPNSTCTTCQKTIQTQQISVTAPRLGKSLWHPGCFKCVHCDDLLVDLAYCVYDDNIYCERHYAEKMKPRCEGCDEEKQNGNASSTNKRIVLKGQEETGRSSPIPLPLPKQFVVTEEVLTHLQAQKPIPNIEIRDSVCEAISHQANPSIEQKELFINTENNEVRIFETTSAKLDQFLTAERLSPARSRSPSPIPRKYAEAFRRSPSPFPSFELMAPRNSICTELLDNPPVSVMEVDEECYRSKSPSPENYIVEHTNNNTVEYRTNKVKVTTPERSKSPNTTVVSALSVPQGTRSRSKSESDSKDYNFNTGAVKKATSQNQVTIEEDFSKRNSEDVMYDESFLNELDGVKSKHKGRNRKQRRKSTQKNNSLDKPSTSTQQTTTYDNEGKKKEPEPFWLIFSGEYTKAMNKDWHGQHFCCWQCDESLTGQRYVLRDEHPYCVSCYESAFANACEKCSRIIGIDSKDLSYKDKHWHEACFLCTTCGDSLVDKQFGSKGDRIYCGRCYDEQFASKCDGCHEIFRAGTKKMEYKTRQWHEKCFCCCVCKVPIGTQSFIPREQEIYCATCYEEKFATRCIKCNKVITSGGVTYKNEPWHRECFTCTHCTKSLAGERFTSRDEKPYCAECFGELFAKRCFACNNPITGIGGTKFISFEDRHWHNDCFHCATCKISLVGRGFITDQDDIICPDCAKQKLM